MNPLTGRIKIQYGVKERRDWRSGQCTRVSVTSLVCPPDAVSTEKPSASLATPFSLKDLKASPLATGVSP
jgi:hypothetical protein